ncbi:Zn finger protein HypA/HybF (possibly regulating hydrogenase expression) [Alteromonadaceae bacterium Bs31]|nr:Zn finger protein HypA/HybF (possibly regulating hydrogenase expression) [Alteromonadaceae bacterium Bs31]
MARREYVSRHGNLPIDQNLVVTSLTLRLGLFSGVDKGLLKRAFQVALHDFHCYWPSTPETQQAECDGVYFSPTTQLIIEQVSASIYCRECGSHYPVSQQSFQRHYLSCPNNHRHITQLISGDEMLLINMQMHPESASTCISEAFKNNNTQEGNSHV